jgi:ADP-ribosyl-[dinitrogen reductase] hydrolase
LLDRSALQRALAGALVGAAVADALGLPFEGLSPRRAARMFPGPLRHRFVFGRAMVSDDTEHAVLQLVALARSQCEPHTFGRALAWRLRFWFMGLPAGIGLATLRACLKLMLGFGYKNSGVRSAGNGPAMRAAALGVLAQDSEHLRALVGVSTRITHTDQDAYYGALLVAMAARIATHGSFTTLEFRRQCADQQASHFTHWRALVDRVADSVDAQQSTREFAASEGLQNAISGYVLHTVPVCSHAALSHPQDYRSAVTTIISCGGDADTTAAIVGAIVGAGVGVDTIPSQWRADIADWRMSLARINALVDGFCARSALPSFALCLRIPRNLVFLLVVLTHGFRPLLPPY